MGRDDGAAVSTMRAHLTQVLFTLTVRITFRALEASIQMPYVDFAEILYIVRGFPQVPTGAS